LFTSTAAPAFSTDEIEICARGDTVTATDDRSSVAAKFVLAADLAITVMIVVPGATVDTTPVVELTVATSVLAETYSNVAAVAPVGWLAVAPICDVPPIASEIADGVTLSDVIPVGSAVTVTTAAAVSVVVVKPVPEPVTATVIVVTPGATVVKTPVVAFTVATDVFDDAHALLFVTAGIALLNTGVSVTV